MQDQTIFFIDDDHDIRVTVRQALENEGYKVSTYANGKDALKALQNHTPRLIVIDLIMPIMNGEEFLKAKQANPAHANIPVVIISAYENKLKLIDYHPHIKKPFDMNKFLNLISEAMESRHVRTP